MASETVGNILIIINFIVLVWAIIELIKNRKRARNIAYQNIKEETK